MKAWEQARALLLQELTGTTRGTGLLFETNYTTLLKITQILRLETKAPLKTLLHEITTQRPTWRVEEETTQGERTYVTPSAFLSLHRESLSTTAWLEIQPQRIQGVVATLHLDDGSLFVLVVPVPTDK